MRSVNGHLYSKGKKIGSGTYGDVFLVKRNDDKKFAYKEYIQETDDLELGALREISILKMFQDTNEGIINLEDIIVNKRMHTVGVILPYYPRNLFDVISSDNISKKDRKNITYKILKAINFMHENGVIHRDIKLDNILMDNENNPIIADFTLSKVFRGMCRRGTHTGDISTNTYRAPEILQKKPYDFSVDAWSLGVVLYEMYTKHELELENDDEAVDFLLSEVLNFKNTGLCNIIRGFLQPNPEKRLTVKQALESDFFDNKRAPKAIKVWSGIGYINNEDLQEISNEIRKKSKYYDIDKEITIHAANKYFKTGCSARSAIELACKFYETELLELDRDEYADDELFILEKMDYNLFV